MDQLRLLRVRSDLCFELDYGYSLGRCRAARNKLRSSVYAKRLSHAQSQGAKVGQVLPYPSDNGSAPNIERILSLTSKEMAAVNALILSKARSDVDMIPELARHLIDSGGKRLRPVLTIAGAQMCGYEGEDHVTLAASVEFMHTATLLHDDVVDESDLRRGKKAARMIWGNQASVLVGDYLLGQAFRMMVDVGNLGCLDILSHAATVIAEGEVMQLQTAQRMATTEDEYLAVIRAKTAALFAAATEVGPVLTGSSSEERSSLQAYGINLGIAFQLIDDALDYSGKQRLLGKNVGDDLREGKVTLPVVLAYRRGDDEERSFWKRVIEEREYHDEDLDHAIALLVKHGTLEDTVARARHYGDMALDALAIFPDGEHKSAMKDVVGFCISRAV